MPKGYYTRKRKTLADRFWPKVDKRGPDECWPWTAYISPYIGYGWMGRGGRGNGGLNSHRASWEVHFGPVPDGLCVLHKCDNRVCVNPAHLFLGTKGDNMRDCIKKGRYRNGYLRGEASPLAKLTEVQVREILADSRKSSEIARAYNVSHAAIWMIKTRRKWRHVA